MDSFPQLLFEVFDMPQLSIEAVSQMLPLMHRMAWFGIHSSFLITLNSGGGGRFEMAILDAADGGAI